MNMKFARYFFLIQCCLYSNFYEQNNLKIAERGDNYRAWVYFIDKHESKFVKVNQRTVERRTKNNFPKGKSWYDKDVSNIYIEHLLSMGIKIKNKSRWLNAVSVVSILSDLERISELPFVKKIEPVMGFKKNIIQQDNEISPLSREFDYGEAKNQIEQINVHTLHNQGFTGLGVRILLMDTGFDLTHNSLGHINVISQWDVINDDNQTANQNYEEEDINQDSHGTMVLSTIASFAPNEFIGVAYDAEFLLAKTEDVSQEIQQEEDNYIVGLEWGEVNGADVVSTSLGYLDWYEYVDMDGNTAATTIAVDIAAGLGMVCVTAAGNSGDDNWYYIISPADADSVISVGAVSEDNQIAAFSSHGPSYDGRIKPEVCARGLYTWCISASSTVNYTRKSGTSLACPLVGGAAALIIQAQPNWTAMEVRESIIMTASMSSNPNNSYGYGIMNAGNAKEYYPIVSIDDKEINPRAINILSSYPNPFNSSISIAISIDEIYHLDIDVLSLDGKVVSNIYNKIPDSRKIDFKWNPEILPSGIYFLRASYKGNKEYRKVTYIK